MSEWNIDKTSLLELLGKTIYRPENVLVEIAANSYDADASIVKINSSGDNEIIQVIDDGCGMDEGDLSNLITIAHSYKKSKLEKKEYSPKYCRKYLGSFGIGIISFLSLGNSIKIFTKTKDNITLFIHIKRELDTITGKTLDIPISAIESDLNFSEHLIYGGETISGTTIEIENTKLDFSKNFKRLKYKLANLPISNDFKIYLNESEIGTTDHPVSTWFSKNTTISLDEIDGSYVSVVDLHIYYNQDNPKETLAHYKRGLFLKVHGRVIENDLYQKIRSKLTSPGSIDARLSGFIEADYLFNKIQANREDFFDNKVIDILCEKIEPELQNLINDFLLLKEYVSEDAYITEFNRQKDKAEQRIQSIHSDLSRIGVKFKYEPRSEMELVLIISELCQKRMLDFEIISTSSASHIDCFVQWPIEQNRRMPNFIGHLEIETYLHKFFTHQHDYRTKPEIICWTIDEKAFEREVKKYKAARPESIVSIKLKDPSADDQTHFKHHKEVEVKIRKNHDEFEIKVLRVYVVTKIIQ